jgi:arylsulfatase
VDRREFLKNFGLGAASVALAGCGGSPLVKTIGRNRPNIVLILCDDMGYSDISCYGGEIDTPNLDLLASNGLRFTQFYNAARCCPTRASLLTGLYPHECGVGNMVYSNRGAGYLGYLNDHCVTLAEVLKSAGYHTMMAGKWHVGHEKGQWPTDRGFDRFYGIHKHVDSYYNVLDGCTVYLGDKEVIAATNEPANQLHPDKEWYTTDVFTDYALKLLDEATGNKQPFFLYLAYNAPHWPIEAPEENIVKFRGKYLMGWDKLRRRKLARMKELGIVKEDTELSPSENTPWVNLSETDQKELAFRRAIYAAQIDRMDQNIGRVIEHFKKSGVLDNTLILFLSDNGCSAEKGMFGYNYDKHKIANYSKWRKLSGRSASQGQAWANASNTPFRLYKKWAHEGGIATPLIAHWPAVIKKGGALTHQPGHVIDIMATFCDVGRARYPERFGDNSVLPLRGKSLLPVFRGHKRKGHEAIFWEHIKHAAIRQGRWKLVSKDATGSKPWELYDIENDRTELNDLAEEFGQRAEQMKQKWIEWASRVNVLPWPHER